MTESLDDCFLLPGRHCERESLGLKLVLFTGEELKAGMAFSFCEFDVRQMRPRKLRDNGKRLKRTKSMVGPKAFHCRVLFCFTPLCLTFTAVFELLRALSSFINLSHNSHELSIAATD